MGRAAAAPHERERHGADARTAGRRLLYTQKKVGHDPTSALRPAPGRLPHRTACGGILRRHNGHVPADRGDRHRGLRRAGTPQVGVPQILRGTLPGRPDGRPGRREDAARQQHP